MHNRIIDSQTPIECLLGIVGKVGDDIATLRALLTVNSFFFHAMLPHLVEVWMRMVDRHIIKPDFAALNQFAILLAASVYHHPRGDLQTSAHSMDNLLQAHGFKRLEAVTGRK